MRKATKKGVQSRMRGGQVGGYRGEMVKIENGFVKAAVGNGISEGWRWGFGRGEQQQHLYGVQ